MHHHPMNLLRVLLLSVFVTTTASLAAQNGTATTATQDPDTTAAALAHRIETIRGDSSLAEESKAAILETLARALDHAQQRDARRDRQRELDAQRGAVPARLAERKRELQTLDTAQSGPTRDDLPLAEIEQGLAAAEKRQRDAQQRLAAADAERNRRSQRRSEIPTRLAELQQQLSILPEAPAAQDGVDVRLATARRLAWTTDRQRLQAAIDTLQAELQLYDAEVELLRTEGDVAARLITTTQADAEAWRARAQPMREQAAAAAAAQARRQAARASEAVAPIAQENGTLADTLRELASKRSESERKRVRQSQLLKDLEQQYQDLRTRVGIVANGNERIGTLLRRRRAELIETLREHQSRVRARVNEQIDAELDRIGYDDRRRRIVQDPSGWLHDQLAPAHRVEDLSPEQLEVATQLRDDRRVLLEQLTGGFEALAVSEKTIAETDQALSAILEEYSSYVTERVLGIRSAQPLWRFEWRHAGEALAWFSAPSSWQDLAATATQALQTRPWLVLALLVVLVLLAARRRFLAGLQAAGERARRGTNVSYAPTVWAVVDTLLLSLPAPTLLATAALSTERFAPTGSFAKASAAGLLAASIGWGAVATIAAIARPNGLGEAHFRWQITTLPLLRRSIVPLWLAAVPLRYAIATLHADGRDEWLGSLGSVFLLAQLTLLLLVAFRLLHPSRGIIGGSLKPRPGAVYRFRKLWFVLGTGLLLTFTVMTVLGYEFTTQQLKSRLLLTVAWLALLGLVQQLILRGLLLQRRRMQIAQAQSRLQAAKAGEAIDDEHDGHNDPQELTKQTQALLRSAVTVGIAVLLYQVWVDVLPALGLLDQFDLWDIGSDGNEQWITLADVLLGVFLLAASVIAARNLPALLELFVLQRLSMAAGERNAITTLARYVIIIAGVLWSFSSIGIGWSKVQWLVAAISVGLGFGLQEIFANFVSGLILLIERPMRPGDMVTVGDTIGRVTRIQMRATTIRDLTQKELVVPNREFVTSKFVNWTLGDPVVRYSVPVGVAYGSDTRLALQLLLEAAKAAPLVLDDPAPEAYFVRFGDSTLDLELRVYVDIDTVTWSWTTQVHEAVDRLFKEHGIVIAFPQRDVNVKLEPNVARHFGDGGAGDGTH